jgi:hypothetical protein
MYEIKNHETNEDWNKPVPPIGFYFVTIIRIFEIHGLINI